MSRPSPRAFCERESGTEPDQTAGGGLGNLDLRISSSSTTGGSSTVAGSGAAVREVDPPSSGAFRRGGVLGLVADVRLWPEGAVMSGAAGAAEAAASYGDCR